ncbi:MAG: TonB family protein [Opitutaceae bacterium]
MPAPLLAMIAAAVVVVVPFVDGAEAELKPGQTPPKVVSRARPEFPYDMKAAGLEGNVTIGFVVDTEGKVRDTRIVRSNNPWFERPAIEALLKWKFEPAVVDGRKVNTRMRLPITFALHGGGGDLWRMQKSKAHDKLPPELQWDEPPEAVSTAFPVYPFEMLRNKVNAKFKVALLVDPAGKVAAVKLTGTPAPEFAGAVRAMAAMWQFEPAKKKSGQPCAALVAIEQEFRADGRGTVPVSESAKEILRELGRSEPRIVAAGALDAEPKDLSFRDLLYPPELKSQGVEGEAAIEFFIDRHGDVQLPRIVSATHEEFGHFAAMMAACWRFEAPRKDGRPVIVRAQRMVRFRVKSEG